MEKYDPKIIESKWQKYWEENKTFSTPEDATADNKFYILPQLPYPSGSGLHVGHAEVYTACDIYARYQRMKGKKVLQVFGLDSFGLPAENYAIKTNIHPKQTIDETGANFVSQVKALGCSVDWDRFVRSSDPGYYKFTQWFFLLMYERGLAYRKTQLVNWCESCKTVLANAQVVDGHCERCDTEVVQKEMEQWYLKITDYADRLLEGLDRIDWPKETIKRQKDWIGKSEGAEVEFRVHGSEFMVKVFTTAHDTIYGTTFMVLAPEHELVNKLKDKIENWDEVEKYISKTDKKTELERQIEKEKTGVELKGVKAINPVNGAEISIWIADYVLASYGTGAIMAVPGADERDYEFAQKFGIEVISVVDSSEEFVSYQDIKADRQKYKLINSEEFDGLDYKVGRQKILDKLVDVGAGKEKIQYKLRDWSISRQRFWGAPIPIVVNEERKNKKRNYIFIHGYTADSEAVFWPWLKKEIEAEGHTVTLLDLPDTDNPKADEQAQYILDNTEIDEDTVIVSHSHGGAVAFKLLEKLKKKLVKVVLVDTFIRPTFNDKKRKPVEESCDWKFDLEKIKEYADEFIMIVDDKFPIIENEQVDEMAAALDARVVYAKANEPHLTAAQEQVILEESIVRGLLPVDYSDLPVILPNDVDFKPTGESPLTYSPSFQDGIEEKYGKGWKREVDTLDTFMCSSWYFFRYLDPKNENEFASPEALKKWMPVDFYLGGPEHVNGHLLYARFFTKVLHDAGYIDFDEPFTVHRHQGLILGPDGRKMSKRWNNVINPTDVVEKYGADTMRMYEMFMGPLEDDKPWDENGVKGVRRFLDRVWNLQEKVGEDGELSIEVERKLHQTIKKVGDDLATLGFNTAIAKLMELVNEFYKQEKVPVTSYQSLVTILAPLAPHMSEELWSRLGNKTSIAGEKWPDYDENKLVSDTIELAVQVNGKVRATIEVSPEASEEEVKEVAFAHDNVSKWMECGEAKKVIYVKGRILNIVV